MSSSVPDLSNETQLRASRTCLLVGTSSSALCKPVSGGGKWYRAGALVKVHVFKQAPSPLSVKEQNACHAVATGSVCPLPCNGWQSGHVAVAGPVAPSHHSSSPVSPGVFTRRAACVTGMAVTPPQPLLFGLKPALAHTSGQMCIGKVGCVLGGWCLGSECLSAKPFFVKGMEKGDTL